MTATRPAFMFLLGLIGLMHASTTAKPAEAACGAVTCFVVIGSQQQVPQKGLLTFNTIYNYTPMRLLDGTNGVIPAIDQANRRLILDQHQEIRTITQTVTFDLNYGITERLGVEVTIPYLWRTHKHIDGLGEEGANGEGGLVPFKDNGIGDMIITAKYNMLPTLRSMIVAGFGVQVPTGSTSTNDAAGELMESPTQLGRGNLGFIGSVYQSYELIPHRLNQFFFGSYRHTFPVLMDRDNKIANQFGVFGLPVSVFIDEKGVVQEYIKGGLLTEQVILDVVARIQKQEPVKAASLR